MRKYFFLAVNYRTSDKIEGWTNHIRAHNINTDLYVVDSFSDENERERATKICNRLGVKIIYSENFGYGNSLNVGLDIIKKDAVDEMKYAIFIFGNLDVSFLKVSCKSLDTACAFMPKIMEGRRNRNPFMTKLQRKFVWVYWPAAIAKSNILFLIAALFIRIIGKIPSKPYASHGSVLCVNGLALEAIHEPIFNKNSFLYWEEMDFADLLNKYQIPLIESDILVEHSRHASTLNLTKSRKKVTLYWATSWRNWAARYK